MDKTKVTKEDIELVAKEIEVIRAKNHDIGMDDLSETLKQVVHAIYGEDDLSCSGYWTRAEHIVKEYSKAKIETFFNTHSGKGIF